MPWDPYLESLTFRRVRYRYRGCSLEFDLSQALFSSAGVDTGTQLLLGLLDEHLDRRSYGRVVDVGCGTGTLGIAIAGSSGIGLEAVDRDALAVAFTERNARVNGIEPAQVRPALAPPACSGAGLSAGPDLVVCNLPAKAGEPVLRMLISRMSRLAMQSGGACAVVIVTPLSELLADELRSLRVEVTAERRTVNHVAAVFREAVLCEPREEPELSAFFRGICEFEGPRRPYRLQSVYNLPEFDGLSYRTAVAFGLLRGRRITGSVLLYGCGQGHLLVGLSQTVKRDATLVVTDRDLLALEITAFNAERCGRAGVATRVVPGIAAVCGAADPGSIDLLVVNDDPVSGSSWNDAVRDSADTLLTPGGHLLLVSRSTAVTRFERTAGDRLRLTEDRRMHGYRAALFRRKD